MKPQPLEIELNREQLAAVTHKNGPLLIIAGAGTGKTTVITQRLKWLISEKLALPNEILALTFTDKAAREMEERVDIALPYGLTQMWITTFHAFGERILRDEAISIGLDPGYRLMTQAESVIFFRRNLYKFDLDFYRPLGNPKKFIEAILTHFSRLKDEDISPGSYLKWAGSLKAVDNQDVKKKYLELSRAFRFYEDLKVKEGVMDFADLISNTLELFRRRKNILNEYRKKFKYILIDEFQDTNFAQNELAVLLAGKNANLTAVGDDDQAIYRFRGAAISNIIQFKKRFRKTKIIVLVKNYRSTEKILDASYDLIQNNNPDRLEIREKINKKLESVRNIPGVPVEYIYRERVEDEADEVAKTIIRLKAEFEYNQMAVLVRANGHADPFIRAFERKGIPYQFLGPGQLFRQPEVKDLIAYLKFLVNQDDSVAFFRVLNMPVFNLGIRDLSALNSFARRIGVNLFDALEIILTKKKEYASYLPYLSESSRASLTQVSAMVKNHLVLAKSDTAGQILFSFLETTGLLKQFTKVTSVAKEKEIQNISKFFDKLRSFEADHEDSSIYAVTDWIDMAMELGESPAATDSDWTRADAVNILTVHSAKGLEFPVVFLVNLVEGRFPSRERSEKIPLPQELIKEILPVGDFHIEEERRLFYVGLTRARDRVFLSASSYYGEAKRTRKISPFVVESMGAENVSAIIIPREKGMQLPLLEWKKEQPAQVTGVPPELSYLSYSQVNTYLTCPLQYKYRYVLKIPVPPSAAASFGSSVHLALQRFYELHKDGVNPDKETLFKLYEESWIPVGYGNPKYEKMMKQRGKNMLDLYYQQGFDKNTQVTDLEKLFRIKLSPGLKLGGKIDRVDKLPDGKLEIIDYKTGKVPKQKDIDASLQMTVYALAAADRGIYNSAPENIILSFYFLEEGKKISTSRSASDITSAKQKLLDVAAEIGKSDFKPKVGIWCDFCDFRLICEAWQ